MTFNKKSVPSCIMAVIIISVHEKLVVRVIIKENKQTTKNELTGVS